MAALQSDLNAKDQALDDAAAENNERELSRRSWFDEAQRLQALLAEWDALCVELRKIATGEMTHNRNGECPDSIEGYATRDIDCPACRALVAADRLLANAEPSLQVERNERAEFEQAFVVQEGLYFWAERNEYRSMNGRSIEYTDATDLNLRLQGWQARAALERKP